MNTVRYRYPGVRPFDTTQSGQFFGRGRDILDLFDRIVLEKLVVVFGKSGYGKSSLLNAGIIPKLLHPPVAGRRFLPVTVRFTPFEPGATATPLSMVRERLAATAGNETPLQYPDATLWHSFKACQQSDCRFVLFFDQFEEFFTYPAEQQVAFREQLAELLYTGIPQSVRDRWDTLDEAGKIRYSETLDVHAVMAIREDRLSWLNSLREALPAILNQRYEIKGLTDDQAREAITGPAALPQDAGFACPPFSYRADALDKLLAELKKSAAQAAGLQPRIEAFLLQICCEDIERRLIESAAQGQSKTVVTPADLPRFEHLYDDYYHRKIQELPAPQQEAARRLIEDELVGLNDATGVVFRLNADGRKLAALPGVTEDLLKKLTACFLLRAEPNSTGGFNYEITHDTLVPPVLQSKERRQAAEKSRLEAEKLTEERRKRKQATMLASGGFLLAAVAIVALFFAVQARNRAKKIAQANGLTSQALQLSATDATRALELVSAALALLPDDKTALQARHDIYASNEFYHRSIACDSVTGAVLSPAGDLILAAAGHLAILFDTAGRRLQVFQHPDRGLNSRHDTASVATSSSRVCVVRFAPDGKQLLTATTEGIVRIWNVQGQLRRELKSLEEEISAAEFSPNGRFVLTGGRNGTAALWSGDDGALIKSWSTHADEITAVDFTPSGDTLLTASWDGQVCLWRAGQESPILRLAYSTPVLTAGFSPDGARLVAGERSGRVHIWTLSGKKEITWPAHTRRVNGARFLPGGTQVFTCSDDRQIKYWDSSGLEIKTYRGHADFVYSIDLRADGAAFISAGADGTIKCWNVHSKVASAFSTGLSSLERIALSPDGRRLLTAAGTGLLDAVEQLNDGQAGEDAFWEALEQTGQPQAVQVWDTEGRLQRTLDGHANAITALAFLPNNAGYASSEDSVTLVWNTDGQIVQKLTGDAAPSLAVSPDGQLLAVGSRIGNLDSVGRTIAADIVLWKQDGSLLRKIRVPAGVASLAFAPDSRQLLSGSYDDTMRVWSLASGQEQPLRAIGGREGRIETVAWSPDGRYLAMGESGPNARLGVWETSGKRLFEQIIRAENKTGGRGVTFVAFSPGSRLLAAAAEGGVVKIYNLQGFEIQTLTDFSGSGIAGLAFSPDGHWIWVGSTDGWVRCFKLI